VAPPPPPAFEINVWRRRRMMMMMMVATTTMTKKKMMIIIMMMSTDLSLERELRSEGARPMRGVQHPNFQREGPGGWGKGGKENHGKFAIGHGDYRRYGTVSTRWLFWCL
jgi:hypothetical protein